MADEGDFDIDPAIAAAMGFSGFGTQPGKKRKFNSNDDTFIDPDATKQGAGPSNQQSAKGANSLPLGARKPPATAAASATDTVRGQTSVGPVVAGGDASGAGEPTLKALRHGIRNERGDMVYFLPSFIEDPWKGLEPR